MIAAEECSFGWLRITGIALPLSAYLSEKSNLGRLAVVRPHG